ncbi:MAG: small acid-soluble spore protein SspI [Bacilli bacterium]|nr:small acid-soluble spore protein SspI [Bacilli bacterium]MDD4076886.1 small acid-soluble spore protein SspI [Bacilli bacterium]MDD4387876.1 small acid-soluble spore protein SspI [Bacilli bacterium]
MNIDIRQAVKNNLNNSSFDDIKSTIVDAMNIKEEKVLPGLGALFEIYWKNIGEEEKNKIVTTITEKIS